MKKEIPNPTKEHINVIYSKNQKKKEIINYFWGEVISVYTILMLISYFITGKLYSKNDKHKCY